MDDSPPMQTIYLPRITDFTAHFILQIIESGIIQFNAPYYGQYLYKESITPVVQGVILFAILTKVFVKSRISFWIQLLLGIMVVCIPWISYLLRGKSFELGPVYGPLVVALPYLITRFAITVETSMASTLVMYLFHRFYPRSLPIPSCKALGFGGIAFSLLTILKVKKVFGFKRLLLAILTLCSIASCVGLQKASIQQCASIDHSLDQIVLQRAESVTGFVSVVRVPSQYGPILLLRCDHSLIGGIYLNYQNISIFGSFYFMDFVRHVKRQSVEPLRALQIGLGIGVSVKTFQGTGIMTDVVEIDPKVYDFATAFFGMPQPSNVFIKDGRDFLDHMSTESVYDFILHDVFTGGIVYPSLFSIESLGMIKKALKVDGVLAMNFVGSRDSLASHTVHSTLKAAFSNVLCFLEDPNSTEFQNIVYYAANFPITFDFSQIPNLSDPSYHDMRDMFRKQDGSLCKNYPNVIVITDNHNPLETLQYQSAISHWYIMRKLLPVPKLWQDYF